MSDTIASEAEPRRPALGASVAVWRGDQVLLAQRAKPPLKGIWSLPGGHVEFGERLEEAAHRELSEETGVAAEIADMVDLVEIIRNDEYGQLDRHFVVAVFAARWVSGEPRAGDDAMAVRWATLDDLDHIALTDGTREVIARSRGLAR